MSYNVFFSSKFIFQVSFIKSQSLMEQQIEKLQQQLQYKYQKEHPERKYISKLPDIYSKPQLFACISNDTFANYISLPIASIIWVVGFLFANQHKVSPIQTNFARYLSQIALQFPLMYFKSEPFHLKHQKDLKLLIIRALISSMNGLATAIFQMFLPLTIYYTLSASTVVFTFLLNFWLYKMQLTSHQIKSIIVALVGIALVINGRVIYEMMLGGYQFSSTFDYSSKDLTVIMIASLGVVVWSFIWAYGIVITGKHKSTINELILVNSLTGLFFFACCQMTIYENRTDVNTLITRKPELFFQLLLLTGVPIALANYLFNLGMFVSTNTGITIMISQINILFVYVISTIKYSQDINYVCLLGAILLLSAIYQVLMKK